MLACTDRMYHKEIATITDSLSSLFMNVLIVNERPASTLIAYHHATLTAIYRFKILLICFQSIDLNDDAAQR